MKLYIDRKEEEKKFVKESISNDSNHTIVCQVNKKNFLYQANIYIK